MAPDPAANQIHLGGLAGTAAPGLAIGSMLSFQVGTAVSVPLLLANTTPSAHVAAARLR